MLLGERPLRILLIEDNPGDARLIGEMLREAPGASARLEYAERLSTGLERLRADDRYDVVLLDLSLPDSQGLHTFETVQSAAPELPIVVLSGLADETVALNAVHAGAQDYLLKGQVDGPLLRRALRYALERMHVEQERRALQRHKDEFFSNVSHDLRTPLAAIKASIGVVLANVPEDLPAPLRRMLGNIDQAADEMSTLVDDLLELSRLQAGRVQLWCGRLDLRDLAERAVRAIEPLAKANQQRVELRLASEPEVANVDADRLRRVLHNLLGNAVKYGDEQGTIRVEVAERASEAHIAIFNSGPGIPPAEQERIFERFYRSGSAHDGGRQGSGLGLPIARALVVLHGGRLWVESTPGHGTIFHVALPRDEAALRS